MQVKQISIGGFLVLGFAIFIAGLLTGIVAVALMPVRSDQTVIELIIFIFGFITGIVTIALTLVTVKFMGLSHKSPQTTIVYNGEKV
ncbi:hypothetical protein HXY32_07695 [Candidatus Bathyarchaeota archaeon]|nr:hypothetical protein [Candidatus Bathyarchaeota archaeon]